PVTRPISSEPVIHAALPGVPEQAPEQAPERATCQLPRQAPGQAPSVDGLLQPGAALMLALGAASVAVSGAAARGAALVNVLKDEDWLLADRWARAERAEGVLARSLGGVEPERAQLTDRWARMGMV